MSTYTPNYSDVGGWKDDEAGGTPATADKLNHIETGILTAHEEIEEMRYLVDIIVEFPDDVANVRLLAPCIFVFGLRIIGGSKPYTYDWDFGDMSPHSTQAAPMHGYNNPGEYIVTATVTDSQGRTAQATLTFCLYDAIFLRAGYACTQSISNLITGRVNVGANVNTSFDISPRIRHTQMITGPIQGDANATGIDEIATRSAHRIKITGPIQGDANATGVDEIATRIRHSIQITNT